MLDKVPEILIDSIGNKWSLDYMKFDNTFAYGKNNYINFNSLNGVVGLFGNNRIGKSSIVLWMNIVWELKFQEFLDKESSLRQ